MGKYSHLKPAIRHMIEHTVTKEKFILVMENLYEEVESDIENDVPYNVEWDVIPKVIIEEENYNKMLEEHRGEEGEELEDVLMQFHNESEPKEERYIMKVEPHELEPEPEPVKPKGVFKFHDEDAPSYDELRIIRHQEQEERRLQMEEEHNRGNTGLNIKARLARLTSKQKTLDSPPSFDKVNKKKLNMKQISSQMARPIIEEGHYSHYMPQSYLCLGFYYDNWLATVIVYGPPVGRNVAGSVFEGGTERNVWELVRLFSYDWAGKNSESRAISLSFKYIKKNHSEVVALISYADPFEGHQGGIYKATNWRFEGRFDYSYPVILVDGKQRHPRGLYSEFGSCGIDFLKGILGNRLQLSDRKTAKLRFTYPIHKKVKFNKPERSYIKKESKKVGTVYDDSSFSAKKS